MPSAIFALTIAAALGCGLAAGVFFAFSTFVMPGLRGLPVPQGVAAMKSINEAAINRWFMTALFGTAAACAALFVATIADWDAPYAPLLLAGATAYLLGVIGVTIAYHVPRNEALSSVDPAAAEAAGHWARYAADWTRWNHLRTAAALIASALQIAAIHAG